ncbi:hypothetical protein AA309_17785 [Microvirga vignae]|uniref:Uncharacterized protein n=1 Tax=Microvirga vignae TaxID=1225564 RepID=A0A0H1R9K5_9HYPH|nr:hypothetical protein AA309_17785 [Microvirga vignae]
MQGVLFAAATLWPHLFSNTIREAARFPDFIKIEGATVERWNNLHLGHLCVFEHARADVIITYLSHSQVRFTRIFSTTC